MNSYDNKQLFADCQCFFFCLKWLKICLFYEKKKKNAFTVAIDQVDAYYWKLCAKIKRLSDLDKSDKFKGFDLGWAGMTICKYIWFSLIMIKQSSHFCGLFPIRWVRSLLIPAARELLYKKYVMLVLD